MGDLYRSCQMPAHSHYDNAFSIAVLALYECRYMIALYWLPHFSSNIDYFKYQTTNISIQYQLLQMYNKSIWAVAKYTVVKYIVAKYTVVYDSYKMSGKLHMMDMWHVFMFLMYMSSCFLLLQWQEVLPM